MSRRSAPQWERVLRALRTAGPRGIDQGQLLRPTIDGGEPIARLASRIEELRDRGYRIDTRRRRAGYAIYVLVGDPAPAATEPCEDAPGALFEPLVGVAPPASPYDEVA